ncbi:PDR/VanB family oxidoreductase [Devosia nitrariae]|uniref:Diguanylate cyclase n=1 Tax=Devosia nitrariae TaxID=2071872 RepID=A0ABQ5W5Q9_9HYPH|nr:PDR/VanB family oxidoreductase [Devosia nitrariae]GLQ55378.1 diguanylate cyclase [Devosia nitrariae]
MRSKLEWVAAEVVEVRQVAQDVRQIELMSQAPLPRFEPGSHTNVRVEIAGGSTTRAYTCLPAPAGRIRIAVKRHENSRGGSRFMWGLEQGMAISVTLPENRFELSWRDAPRLLVAGGIGITPIYGMASALDERSAPFRMVYGGKNRRSMAFADELQARLGGRLALFAADEGARIDLPGEISALPDDGELYVCGPIAMLDAAKAAWLAAGRPVSRLRYEVFGDSGTFAEAPFQVEVARRNVLVDVRPDQTLLEALTGAGVDMVYDCQRGECGLCAVDVVAADAEIDHRDVFFSPEQKREGKRMCACVSRLAGGRAVIDVGYRPPG